MVFAFIRALGDVFRPGLRRVVGFSLALAAASFTALWIAVAILLDRLAPFGWAPLNWLVNLLGSLAVLALSWLLFPAVVTMVMGFFLDRVANAVEAQDYPDRGPPRHVPVGEMFATTLRLMGLTIAVNLLAMPVYILAPGVNFFVFLGVNGYLFGCEYFGVVALRRFDPVMALAVRRHFAGRVFLAGVAIAGLFAVPLVNLVAPVVATAFMVHLFEGLRRAAPQLPAA